MHACIPVEPHGTTPARGSYDIEWAILFLVIFPCYIVRCFWLNSLAWKKGHYVQSSMKNKTRRAQSSSGGGGSSGSISISSSSSSSSSKVFKEADGTRRNVTREGRRREESEEVTGQKKVQDKWLLDCTIAGSGSREAIQYTYLLERQREDLSRGDADKVTSPMRDERFAHRLERSLEEEREFIAKAF